MLYCKVVRFHVQVRIGRRRNTLLGTRAAWEVTVGQTTPQFTGPGEATFALGRAVLIQDPGLVKLLVLILVSPVCKWEFQIKDYDQSKFRNETLQSFPS